VLKKNAKIPVERARSLSVSLTGLLFRGIVILDERSGQGRW